MTLTLIKDIARPHVLDIIMLLKRGRGMSVNELSAALRMSYMGVKQHCIYLEKKGYLGTWLRPKAAGGRPEKMYRLTPKMNGLFPSAVGKAVLDMIEAAEAAMGAEAVKAMLAGWFERQGDTRACSKAVRWSSARNRWPSSARTMVACRCASSMPMMVCALWSIIRRWKPWVPAIRWPGNSKPR